MHNNLLEQALNWNPDMKVVPNVLHVFTSLDIPCLAGDCPEKDQSCVTADGSNVITTTTTIDDAECGRKLSILYIILGV